MDDQQGADARGEGDGGAVEWRPVTMYGGVFADFYEVSDGGDVRRVPGPFLDKNGRLVRRPGWDLTPYPDKAGRRCVRLHRAPERRMVRVYRLVAHEFVPNPEGKGEVNHLNGCPWDDRAENLAWCTRAENMAHAVANGLCFGGPERVPRGERHHRAKLSRRDVLTMREMARTDRTAAVRYGRDQGASYNAAWAAATGRSWRHLPMP